MNSPLVSVCIVTFNHEKYIHDCVMSVVAQADQLDIEILIGDDRSGDSTQTIVAALVEQYPNIIRYYRNATRLGPVGNILSLAEKARGKFIAHLDGDDLWLPGKLAAQVAYLDQNPDCPAVYTNAFTISDDGTRIGLFNNRQKERFSISDLVARGNFLCHSSVLYRAALKPGVLALPAPFIDYRIHLLHARHGDVGYLNEALVKYRVNSATSMLIHSKDLVRELYWEALLDVPRTTVGDKTLAGAIAKFGKSVFFNSLKRRDISRLRKWLPEIMKASPIGRTRMAILLITAIIRGGVQYLIWATRLIRSDHYARVLHRN